MVSIAILAYNNLNLLEFTCNSLWKNTTAPLEIMIWDNGSDKATKDWCNKQIQDPTKDFWYSGNGTNRPISQGWNTMVRESKYDYIFFSDNDIYFFPNWDIILAELDEIGSWRMPMMIEANRPNRSIKGNYGYTPQNFNEKKLLKDYKDKIYPHRRRGNFLPAICRKDDFEKIGGWNENFFVGEADFLWRAWNYYKSLGKEMLTHPKSYIYHFRGASKRPAFWGKEKRKLQDYVEKTTGHSYSRIDKIMDYYKILRPEELLHQNIKE